MSEGRSEAHRRLTSRIVAKFLTSQLSLLLLIASFLAGAAALYLTPREEEPQIVVPFADVFVRFPGATAEETEKLVATPLEAKLWEIDGVEYVYSMSRPGEAVATVRFYVGEDRERSLVKVWNKLMSNQNAMPPGVTSWIVKPVKIDDVPIVLFTLWSPGNRVGSGELRRIADELLNKLNRIPNTGRSWVVGGEPRQISVYVDPAKLAARGLSLLEVVRSLQTANVNVHAGAFERGGREVLLEVGPFFRSAAEVEHAVIAAPGGQAVYLRDVARVVDGPREVESYTRIGFGPAAAKARTLWLPPEYAHAGQRPEQLCPEADGRECPAVTIAVAKRKGTNAVWVAEALIRAVEEQRGVVIPDDVAVTITRDYGETANHKVNELVKHLFIAVATILVLLAIADQWNAYSGRFDRQGLSIEPSTHRLGGAGRRTLDPDAVHVVYSRHLPHSRTVRPTIRNARRDFQDLAIAQSDSKNRFDHEPVQPSGGSGVPRPPPTATVRSL
jgi:multidrug efflux pump subunit AcrB